MSRAEQVLAAMGEGWWASTSLSATLREPPSTTRGTLKHLTAQGRVRYDAEQDAFQAYPVREAIRDFLHAHRTQEYNAAAVAEALPELGLSAEQMHALLADLGADGSIEVWFTAAQA